MNLAFMVMGLAMMAAARSVSLMTGSKAKYPTPSRTASLLNHEIVFFPMLATFQESVDICRNYKKGEIGNYSYAPILSQNRYLNEYFDHFSALQSNDSKIEKKMALWTGAFVLKSDPTKVRFLNEPARSYEAVSARSDQSFLCPSFHMSKLKQHFDKYGNSSTTRKNNCTDEPSFRMVFSVERTQQAPSWYKKGCLDLVYEDPKREPQQQFYVACELMKFPVRCEGRECGTAITDKLHHPRMIQLNTPWEFAHKECLLLNKQYSLAGLDQATGEFIDATSRVVRTSDRGVWIGGSVDLQNSTKDRILIRWVDGRSSTFEDLPKEIWCPSFKTDALNLISSLAKGYREREIAFIKRDKGNYYCLSIQRSAVDWDEIRTYAPLCIVDHFDLQTDYDFDVTIYTRNTTFMELLHVCKKNFDPKSTHETLSFAHMPNDKVGHAFQAIVQQLKLNEGIFLGRYAATALIWTGQYFERQSRFGILYTADRGPRREGVSSFAHIAQHFCVARGIKSNRVLFIKTALEELIGRYGKDLNRVYVVLKYVRRDEACLDLYPQLFSTKQIRALAACQSRAYN